MIGSNASNWVIFVKGDNSLNIHSYTVLPIDAEKQIQHVTYLGYIQDNRTFDSKAGALMSAVKRYQGAEYKDYMVEGVKMGNKTSTTTSKTDIKNEDVEVLRENTKEFDSNTETVNKTEDIEALQESTEEVEVDDLLSYKLVSNILNLGVQSLKTIFRDRTLALACVDGAYKADTGRCAYAYVIIVNGEVYERSAEIHLNEASSTNAEIQGVRHVVAELVALGVKEAFLIYDCEYVRSVLKTKKSKAHDYIKFMKLFDNEIKLHWVKVKGHSGIPLHTQVDIAAGLCIGRTI